MIQKILSVRPLHRDVMRKRLRIDLGSEGDASLHMRQEQASEMLEKRDFHREAEKRSRKGDGLERKWTAESEPTKEDKAPHAMPEDVHFTRGIRRAFTLENGCEIFHVLIEAIHVSPDSFAPPMPSQIRK